MCVITNINLVSRGNITESFGMRRILGKFYRDRRCSQGFRGFHGIFNFSVAVFLAQRIGFVGIHRDPCLLEFFPQLNKFFHTHCFPPLADHGACGTTGKRFSGISHQFDGTDPALLAISDDIVCFYGHAPKRIGNGPDLHTSKA